MSPKVKFSQESIDAFNAIFQEGIDKYKTDLYLPPINEEALTDIDTGLPCTGCRTNRELCGRCKRKVIT